MNSCYYGVISELPVWYVHAPTHEFTSESVTKHMELLVSQNLSYTQPGVVEVHGFSSHLKNLLAPSQKPKFKFALVTSLVCLVFESFF